MSARSIKRTHEREIERVSMRRSRAAKRAGVAAGAALGAGMLLASGAQAANLVVNTGGDAGDNTCDASCTLRDAVGDSNVSGADDVITFAPSVTGEITLTAGQIPITDSVTITGPGAAALAVSGDANNNDNRDLLADSRIFASTDPTPAEPLQQVHISGLTLREGVAGGPASSNMSGGAVYSRYSALSLDDVSVRDSLAVANGGGVAVFNGTVDVSGSALTANHAYNDGGGLTAMGPTTMTDTAISGNRAGVTAGSDNYPSPSGGGVYVSGEFSIDDMTITNNVASGTALASVNTGGDGGGASLFGDKGVGTISDSTISGNESLEHGGGLELGHATIQNSTITDNESASGGGVGLYPRGKVLSSTVVGNSAETGGGVALFGGGDGAAKIDDATITGNSATGLAAAYSQAGKGGGIFAAPKYGGSNTVVDVRSSTVASNTASVSGGGIYAYNFTDYASDDPIVVLKGSVAANSSAPGIGDDLGSNQSNLVSAGFSLIESPGAVTVIGDPDGSNLEGVDPQLGPLANNGGPTKTLLPANTSPVVDAAQTNQFTTDQRGLPRTVNSKASDSTLGDGTDMGSVEVQGTNATGDDDVTRPQTKLKKPKKKFNAKKSKAKVKFKFKGTDDGPGELTFDCKLDAGKYKSCSSPFKAKVGLGKHKFSVRAVDAVGNKDKSPATVSFKVVKKAKKKA
jgi:hypothetical protein